MANMTSLVGMRGGYVGDGNVKAEKVFIPDDRITTRAEMIEAGIDALLDQGALSYRNWDEYREKNPHLCSRANVAVRFGKWSTFQAEVVKKMRQDGIELP